MPNSFILDILHCMLKFENALARANPSKFFSFHGTTKIAKKSREKKRRKGEEGIAFRVKNKIS